MVEPIHILLIDDSPAGSSDIEAFEARARAFGMKVKHCIRGANGLDEIKANPSKYRALVLDARCIWDENGSVPNDKFLNQMVLELERLELDLKTSFLAVVNTAYMDAFAEDRKMMLNRGGEIFHKSSESSEDGAIFKFLKERIENSIEWTYRDALDVFETGYLPVELRSDLLQILHKLNDHDQIKNNFTPVRKFLEAIYFEINRSSPTLVPPEVFFRRTTEINLEWTWKYLSGLPVYVPDHPKSPFKRQRVFPEHVSLSVKVCKDLSSKISHLYIPDVEIYAYRSVVNSLLEILIWYREFRDAQR